MNFKLGRRVPRDSPDMTPDKSFRYGRDQGHVTATTVPCKLTHCTAAMGQIPRSTERILVEKWNATPSPKN